MNFIETSKALSYYYKETYRIYTHEVENRFCTKNKEQSLDEAKHTTNH